MRSEIDFVIRREDPQTFRARACTVSLTVKDLDASIKWYRDMWLSNGDHAEACIFDHRPHLAFGDLLHG